MKVECVDDGGIEWVDDVYLKMSDGKLHFVDNKALIILLDDHILFPIYGDTKTIELHVICNDLFYWGCADSEQFSIYELEELHKAYKSDDKWAIDKMCCSKRGLQPQVPIVEKMKQDGMWNETLEALPKPKGS